MQQRPRCWLLFGTSKNLADDETRRRGAKGLDRKKKLVSQAWEHAKWDFTTSSCFLKSCFSHTLTHLQDLCESLDTLRMWVSVYLTIKQFWLKTGRSPWEVFLDQTDVTSCLKRPNLCLFVFYQILVPAKIKSRLLIAAIGGIGKAKEDRSGEMWLWKFKFELVKVLRLRFFG